MGMECYDKGLYMVRPSGERQLRGTNKLLGSKSVLPVVPLPTGQPDNLTEGNDRERNFSSDDEDYAEACLAKDGTEVRSILQSQSVSRT